MRSGKELQVAEEVDHRGVDVLGPLLLRPVAATGEHDRLPEMRDKLRQVGNELVHPPEGDHEVPVTGDVKRGDGYTRPGKGGQQFPVAVDIAVPAESSAEAGAGEFLRVEIDVGL